MYVCDCLVLPEKKLEGRIRIVGESMSKTGKREPNAGTKRLGKDDKAYGGTEDAISHRFCNQNGVKKLKFSTQPNEEEQKEEVGLLRHSGISLLGSRPICSLHFHAMHISIPKMEPGLQGQDVKDEHVFRSRATCWWPRPGLLASLLSGLPEEMLPIGP